MLRKLFARPEKNITCSYYRFKLNGRASKSSKTFFKHFKIDRKSKQFLLKVFVHLSKRRQNGIGTILNWVFICIVPRQKNRNQLRTRLYRQMHCKFLG